MDRQGWGIHIFLYSLPQLFQDCCEQLGLKGGRGDPGSKLLSHQNLCSICPQSLPLWLQVSNILPLWTYTDEDMITVRLAKVLVHCQNLKKKKPTSLPPCLCTWSRSLSHFMPTFMQHTLSPFCRQNLLWTTILL